LDVLERYKTAASHKEPDKVPVVFLAYSLVLKDLLGIPERDYYQSARLQLEAKVAFQRRFPEAYNHHMGTFPETGEFTGLTAAAFGGKIGFMPDSAPHVDEYPIKTIEDIDRLVEAGTPDPRRAGICPTVLNRVRYFRDWFPKDLKEKYEYIDHNIYASLLVEGFVLAMGYDKFFVWVHKYPAEIHKWLKLATKFYSDFCDEIEKIVGGPIKQFWAPDHLPSMMGKKQFLEFHLPYFNAIFGRYKKDCLRIWHNEGKVSHMLDEIDKLDADVWQFGAFDDPAECKKRTHFCLQGNLHPPGIMRRLGPKEVEEESMRVIYEAAEGGGLFLSTGGGTAPGTPFENLDAMVDAATKHGTYPIKRTAGFDPHAHVRG